MSVTSTAKLLTRCMTALQVLSSTIHDVFTSYPGIVEGDPWYQGDHGILLINQIPALALTSELVMELMNGITHTPKDTPEMVDAAKLVAVAQALRDLLLSLAGD